MADAKKKAAPKPYKAGKTCPKCGPGVRLGNHQKPVARMACGRCGYTEMVSAAPAPAAVKAPAHSAAPAPAKTA